jgi:hypothetical protein
LLFSARLQLRARFASYQRLATGKSSRRYRLSLHRVNRAQTGYGLGAIRVLHSSAATFPRSAIATPAARAAKQPSLLNARRGKFVVLFESPSFL